VLVEHEAGAGRLARLRPAVVDVERRRLGAQRLDADEDHAGRAAPVDLARAEPAAGDRRQHRRGLAEQRALRRLALVAAIDRSEAEQRRGGHDAADHGGKHRAQPTSHLHRGWAAGVKPL
jgi:hypothetical protein